MKLLLLLLLLFSVCCCSCYIVHYCSCCSRSIKITLLLEQVYPTECLVLFIVFPQMKEDVETTELALAFPLFGDSDQNANLGKRHQVKCTALLPQVWIIVKFQLLTRRSFAPFPPLPIPTLKRRIKYEMHGLNKRGEEEGTGLILHFYPAFCRPCHSRMCSLTFLSEVTVLGSLFKEISKFLRPGRMLTATSPGTSG